MQVQSLQRKRFFVFLKALHQVCFTWGAILTGPCSCGDEMGNSLARKVLGGTFQAAVGVGEGPHLWV